VLLGACAHAPPQLAPTTPELTAIAGPATTCTGTPSTWADRAEGRDRIRYAVGLEADADRAEAGLKEVRAALAVEVGVPSDATSNAVIWLTTASETIRTGVADTETSGGTATVFLFSPSCDHDTRPLQFEKTISQELSGEYLEAASVASPDGWVFYSSPNWFMQGAEEWVTVLVHDRPSDIPAAATSLAKRPPSSAIRIEAGEVKVDNDYRDGEALVAWLTVTRGPDVVRRIVASDAVSFDDALHEVTGVDAAALIEQYQGWRTSTQ
jgi:hypothetical protein